MRVTSFARRCSWHLRALGFNPLIRATDRLEALVVLGVLACALLAAPAASQAGDQLYQSGVRTAAAQAQHRHAVHATVVEGTTGLPTDFDGPPDMRVQWSQGAQVRTEQVVSPGTVKSGDSVTVWLNDTGKVVAAPLTIDDAKINAAAATVMVWVVLVVCSALLALVIRLVLDRVRYRAWERELHLLAHNDDGWANRHI
jgi:hypothetical protein